MPGEKTRAHPDHCILWRRLDLPGHESARLLARGSGWRLHGTAVFLHDQRPCRLDYRVVCDAEWRTLSTKVTGWVGTEPVKIELLAGPGPGEPWRFNGAERADVVDCVDVDLAFSPSTNLLPIRRVPLAIGQEAQVRAAWLRFPGFTLEPFEQTYRRLDERTYRYESAGGAFMADLVVDDAGMVTHYPGLWQREAGIAWA